MHGMDRMGWIGWDALIDRDGMSGWIDGMK